MNEFDETFDFIVVGSGAASMCAGLVMREAGRSVLIVEKTALIGGTTAKSGGVMWIPNNPFMKRDGIPDSPEQAMQYLESLIGDAAGQPGATRERRRAYVEQAPKMVEFLVRGGVKLNRAKYWPDYYDDLPGGSEAGRCVVAELFDVNELGTWRDKLRPGFLNFAARLEETFTLRSVKHSWSARFLALRVGLRTAISRLTGKRLVSSGAALQGRMLQAALKAGVQFSLDTAVHELVMTGDAVTGVAATKGGKPWRAGARLGVLVNAGGFARNQAMRDQYQPGTRVEWSNATEGDTGEMILEMQRLGAATAQMEEFVGFQTTMSPGAEEAYVKPPGQSLTAAPHAILVDQSGVRYQNEGGSYMAYCRGMLERHKTVPAVPSWAILDTQYLRNYMLGYSMPGVNKPASWTEQGYLRKADTIEALAAQLGIDPATLKATVERFNGFVAANNDEDFHRGARAYDRWLGDPHHKPSPTLGAIAEAPFYAVPMVPGDVGTYGGVVTDVAGRVLREDGSVITGLYAAGVSTAGVMGRFYAGAGASVGPAMTWGYISARHAAGVNS
ncbi:FAD-dependent oxidoreductase [Acidocella sp.]|uniref:FAD-dependent oxidoreductase n=1 Tax=Acidocella sp. TaxID=50710 RepID=UPI00260FEF6A|nr:FAD-dependent oxidoreductase [Acidocella sp.]